ncbi:MAG: hypothetical protein ACOYL3_23785 [Desulfuromonadaceae bacterium]
MKKPAWSRKTRKIGVARPKSGTLQLHDSQQPGSAPEQQPVEIRHAVKIMVGIVSVIVIYCFFFVFGGTLGPATFERTKLSEIGSHKQPVKADRNYGVTISKLKGGF